MDAEQKDMLMHMDYVNSFVFVCYGCPADGLADAHGHYQLWLLLFTVDVQQMNLLMDMDTGNSCYYCSLWMPQQMDMLLHMDIVNIIVIVITVIKM